MESPSTALCVAPDIHPVILSGESGKIAFEKTGEGLAMPGLILAHLMDGIMNGVEVQFLGLDRQYFLSFAGTIFRGNPGL